MNVVIAQQSLPFTLTTGGRLSDNFMPGGFLADSTMQIMAGEVERRMMFMAS